MFFQIQVSFKCLNLSANGKPVPITENSSVVTSNINTAWRLNQMAYFQRAVLFYKMYIEYQYLPLKGSKAAT